MEQAGGAILSSWEGSTSPWLGGLMDAGRGVGVCRERDQVGRQPGGFQVTQACGQGPLWCALEMEKLGRHVEMCTGITQKHHVCKKNGNSQMSISRKLGKWMAMYSCGGILYSRKK